MLLQPDGDGKTGQAQISLIFQEIRREERGYRRKLERARQRRCGHTSPEGRGVPAGAQVLPLGSSGGASGHRFKTYGFPDARSTRGHVGIWRHLAIVSPNRPDRVFIQLTGATEITPGFSGGPLSGSDRSASNWHG